MDSLRISDDDLCLVDRLQGKSFGHFTMIFKSLQTSVALLLILTVVTGLIYPFLVTGIAQLVFPAQANGSLIVRGGKAVGSELIGQPFNDPRYFWSRPSATTLYPYNASASSGSNRGPLNPELLNAVRQRVRDLKAADSLNTQPVPVDLVTASGSGLDPHISILAALYQVPRVARTRGLSEDRVRTHVHQHTEGRQFGVLGEPRVNVLLLNIDLDGAVHNPAGM
jgi:K+-transporting ATPase ATPase C chain